MGVSTFGGSTTAGSVSPLQIGQVVQAVGGPGLIQANGQVISQTTYPTLYGILNSSISRSLTNTPMQGTTVTAALPASGSWTGTYLQSANLYVAIMTGTSGTMVATSPTGTTWTAGTLPTTAVWYSCDSSPSIMVVAGANGALATTTDGVTWTASSIPNITTGTAPTVFWTGTRFVWCDVTAFASYYSTDGVTWKQTSIPITGSGVGAYGRITSIGGTSLISTGGPTSYYGLSTDNGATWKTYPMPGSATFSNKNMVAYTGTTIFMVTYNGMYSSTDGVTWTTVTKPYSGLYPQIYYYNNALVVTSTAGSFVSTDNGTSWKAMNITTVQGAPTGTFSILAVGCNTAGTTVVGPIYGTSLAMVSVNSGTAWSLVNLPVMGNWTICQWNGTNFVMLGDNTQYALQSPDGLTWTVVNSNVPAVGQLTAAATNGSTMVVTVGNNIGRTGGATTSALTSPDNGTTWNTATLPVSAVWNGVAANSTSGMFVAVAGYSIYTGKQNAASTAYAYSSDGINWSAGTFPAAIQPCGVAYSAGAGGFWVTAYGATKTGYWSANGTTWTATTLGTATFNSETIVGNATYALAIPATAVTAEGYLSASGTVGSLTSSGVLASGTTGVGPACMGANNFIFYSNGATIGVQNFTGGATVSNASQCPSGTQWQGMVFGGNSSTLFGVMGNIFMSVNTSTGYVTYKTIAGAALTTNWLTPVWDGSVFVLMANGSTARYSSADGSNWTYAVSGTAMVTDPAANPATGVMTASIATAAYYSSNHGVTWTAINMPWFEATTALQTFFINGNAVLACGSSTSSATLTATNATPTANVATNWAMQSPLMGGTTCAPNSNNAAFNGNTVIIPSAGTVNGGYYYSLNGGSTWTRGIATNGTFYYGCTYSQALNKFMCFHSIGPTYTGILAYSSDGVTWTNSTSTSVSYNAVISLGTLIFATNNYFTTSSTGVFYTIDGVTWNTLPISGTVIGYGYQVLPNANGTQAVYLPSATAGNAAIVFSKTYDERSAMPVPTYTVTAGSPPWFIKAL